MTKRKSWKRKGYGDEQLIAGGGGLLKRAASDEVRQYVAKRRTACIKMAIVPRKPEKAMINALRIAATKTLADMGIDLKKEDPLRGRYERAEQDKRKK